MTDEHDANQPRPGDDERSRYAAQAVTPDTVALLRRIEYLEWLTTNMAADLTALRRNAPKAFQGRIGPSDANASPISGARINATQADTTLAPPPTVLEGPAPVSPFANVGSSGTLQARSLESQFGSQILSKIAIVLLLIGSAWFLKWAFENRWIGPAGRVIIGLAGGVGVVVWSERFRRDNISAFSYALKAVGSGVLYLSLWAAFQLYHLIPAPVVFAAMIAVTAWNAYMSWAQDAVLLAAYALLGAYLTPLLLSTGGDHEVFLFNYLLVIAASVVALLRLKPWSRLLLGVLPATTAFFVGWYSSFFRLANADLTLIYALLLWAVFVTIPFLSISSGTLVDVLTPIFSAVFGSLTVYSVLVDSARKPQEAWWAIGFAATYLGLARIRSRPVVSAVHLSLAIVFLTVAIPLKATGHGITVGWLAEALTLLWIATLPTIDPISRTVIRQLAYVSLALGFAGALLGAAASSGDQQPFLNRNFITALGAVATLLIAIWIELQRNIEGESRRQERTFAAVATVAIEVLLLTAMYREITHYALAESGSSYARLRDLAGFGCSAWMLLQGTTSLALGFRLREPLLRWIGLVLIVITILKVFLYDIRDLGTGYRVVCYLGVGVVLMAVSYAYQRDWLGLREAVSDEAHPGAHS